MLEAGQRAAMTRTPACRRRRDGVVAPPDHLLMVCRELLMKVLRIVSALLLAMLAAACSSTGQGDPASASHDGSANGHSSRGMGGMGGGGY